MTHTDLVASHKLLKDVFEEGPTTELDYLVWLYQNNPAGEKIQANLDDADGRIGHYTVVPQPYSKDGAIYKVALSLNTAVAPRGRGKGLFTRLADDVIAQCQGQEYDGIIGVANDNSTPGFIRKLGFELVQPLPVKLGMFISKSLPNVMVGDDARQRIVELDRAGRQSNSSRLSLEYDRDFLDWRLSRPGADYHAFANERAGIVVTRTNQMGQDFLVILASFADIPGTKISDLVAHAGSELGIKFFVYSGWNQNTSITGLPVPKKYRPSPLNLVWRPVTGKQKNLTKNDIRRFEFLDFDAY